MAAGLGDLNKVLAGLLGGGGRQGGPMVRPGLLDEEAMAMARSRGGSRGLPQRGGSRGLPGIEGPAPGPREPKPFTQFKDRNNAPLPGTQERTSDYRHFSADRNPGDNTLDVVMRQLDKARDRYKTGPLSIRSEGLDPLLKARRQRLAKKRDNEEEPAKAGLDLTDDYQRELLLLDAKYKNDPRYGYDRMNGREQMDEGTDWRRLYRQELDKLKAKHGM